MRGVWLLAGVVALFAAPAQAQVTRAFGEWMVVCDNLKTCTAFGFSDAPGEAWLKVARDAGPHTPPETTLVLRPFDNRPSAEGWTLRADGRALFAGLTLRDDGDSLSLYLSDEQAMTVVDGVRDARALTIEGPGGFETDIVLSGSSAALRFIDDRQGRAGLSDAFAARGAGDPGRAPPAPPLPVVRLPKASAQTGRPDKDPAFIRTIAEHEDCDSLGDPEAFPTIWARLGPDLQLWGGLCSSGAYNFSYKFFTADNGGGQVGELTFPYAPGAGERDTVYVTNADLEPSGLILGAFEKGRGLGDCGVSIRWAWNGTAFVVAEQAVMSDCRGVSSEHWPYVYRASVQ